MSKQGNAGMEEGKREGKERGSAANPAFVQGVLQLRCSMGSFFVSVKPAGSLWRPKHSWELMWETSEKPKNNFCL